LEGLRETHWFIDTPGTGPNRPGPLKAAKG